MVKGTVVEGTEIKGTVAEGDTVVNTGLFCMFIVVPLLQRHTTTRKHQIQSIKLKGVVVI